MPMTEIGKAIRPLLVMAFGVILNLTAASFSAIAADAALVARGESVFKRDCGGCHEVGPRAHHTVGPHLNTLFGRQAGGLPDFKFYSPAMKASGLVWSEENFASFIENPRLMIANTKQVFGGIKNKDEIAALTAYLAGF